MHDVEVGKDLLGDMSPEEFRISARELTNWIATYLGGGMDGAPILAQVQPNEITDSLPRSAPEDGRPMTDILRDFDRLLVPGVTHWNHPGFMGYFPSTGSAPGALAEFLTGALNQQAMLWKSSPVATELEEVALGWLGELIGLPPEYSATSFDGGSTSNLHALLAARQQRIAEVRARGLLGRTDLMGARIYSSEHAHSSIDKAAIVLGLGHESVRRVPVDDSFRMNSAALDRLVREDISSGYLPIAVVATAGTTSCGSVDPIAAIATICSKYGLWLHVDASWAGAAAILPEQRELFRGIGQADSLVINPHKWLFTPLDLSVLFVRRPEILVAALSITPDYLANSEVRSGRNMMDRGIALGRRFRALKLWIVLNYFGATGLRSRIRSHIQLARDFASDLVATNDFRLLAPVSFSLVCFRAEPAGVPVEDLDSINQNLLEAVNESGEAFLSSTRLNDVLALRLVVGHIRTTKDHLERVVALLRDGLARHLDTRTALATRLNTPP